MAEVNDDTVLDFEEGKIWLPSHIFTESFEDKEYEPFGSPKPACCRRTWLDGNPVKHPLFPTLRQNPTPSPWHEEPTSFQFQQPPYPQFGRRWNQKKRFPANRTISVGGGPGMQAVFLDAGQKSCGTGFFLPRGGGKAGSGFHPNKKPSCSPVLLPSRVVQALNLNVHALGPKHVPHQEALENEKKNSSDHNNQINNYESDDEQGSELKHFAFAPSRCSSPEMRLPKEWSY